MLSPLAARRRPALSLLLVSVLALALGACGDPEQDAATAPRLASATDWRPVAEAIGKTFYAIHMLLIPGILMALIGAHLYLVAKLGTTAPPWNKAEPGGELPQVKV